MTRYRPLPVDELEALLRDLDGAIAALEVPKAAGLVDRRRLERRVTDVLAALPPPERARAAGEVRRRCVALADLGLHLASSGWLAAGRATGRGG